MKKLIEEARKILEDLRTGIAQGHFAPAEKPRSAVGWKGPGVTFATDIAVDKRPAFSLGPEPQTVLTPHAQSAGMLLTRIESAFRPLLGSHLQLDFFERISEAADEYTAFIPPEQDTPESFLRVLLREASDILDDMETGEFPCAHFDDDEES